MVRMMLAKAEKACLRLRKTLSNRGGHPHTERLLGLARQKPCILLLHASVYETTSDLSHIMCPY